MKIGYDVECLLTHLRLLNNESARNSLFHILQTMQRCIDCFVSFYDSWEILILLIIDSI